MSELYNRDIFALCEWMDDMKAEMLASQSARLHRGFIPEEKRRYMELLAQIRARVEAMDTGDFPEVHPQTLAE